MARDKTNIEIMISSLRVIATVSTIYIAVVVTALFLQYRQLQKTSLLDFPEMAQLKEMVKTDSDNHELKQRIRQLDLLARRHWFSGLDQLKMGGVLLAGGIVFLLLSLGGARLLTGPPKPAEDIENTHEPNPDTSVFVISTASGLTVLVVISLILFASPRKKTVGMISRPDSGEILSPAADKLPGQASDVVSNISKPDMKSLPESEALATWPHFRGHKADGLALNHDPILDWDAGSGEGIKWKVKVPLTGFSSPLVWKEYVILTGGDKQQRAIFAYDANNGNFLWQAGTSDIPGSPEKLPQVTSDTGYAASTPATNGQQICAIFATGDLLCTDFKGKRLWAKNLGVPDNHYGHSSSLLIVQNRLLVQFDDHNRQILYCFDAATGEILWQKKRESAISWASPVHVQTEDKSLIVLVTSKYVEAYHIETGLQAWSTSGMSGEVASSPAFADGRVFVANEFAQAFALDVDSGEILWQTDEPYLPSVSSPVAFKDMVFLFSVNISCLDTLTGNILWEEETEQEFYSSPLLLRDRIVIFDVKGRMLVIRPDRERMVIEQQITLNEAVVATPAIAQGKMWVRGVENLYCIESGAKGNERR